jgi:hypothetical protein
MEVIQVHTTLKEGNFTSDRALLHHINIMGMFGTASRTLLYKLHRGVAPQKY